MLLSQTLPATIVFVACSEKELKKADIHDFVSKPYGDLVVHDRLIYSKAAVPSEMPKCGQLRLVHVTRVTVARVTEVTPAVSQTASHANLCTNTSDRNVSPPPSTTMFIINWFWDVLAQLGACAQCCGQRVCRAKSLQASCTRTPKSCSWASTMLARQCASFHCIFT